MTDIKKVIVHYEDGEITEVSPILIAWNKGGEDIALSVDLENPSIVIESVLHILESATREVDTVLEDNKLTNLVLAFKNSLYDEISNIFPYKEEYYTDEY